MRHGTRNRGSQITETENCHHLLTTWEAEPRRTRGVANNLGTTSDSWERQVEAGASGVPQDLGKLRGHARRRARAARRAGEKDGCLMESKRARLPEYSPTGRDR